MTAELHGKTVALLVAPEGTEQIELTEPRRAIEDAGGTALLVSTQSGRIQAFNHLDRDGTFAVDTTVTVSKAGEFDALVLPGGVAGPDYLRTVPAAVAFTKAFFDAGKPVAAICHGPWTLIEAGVVRGRTLTSWPSLRTDLRNAGATWTDRQVVSCRNGPNTLITSRGPGDLKAFCRALVETLRAPAPAHRLV
ncbi:MULTISPECIES: type 1 glutamine amidotransferase domain-containing protein [Thermomonospora]|uniref:Intracellular protease, PfpI family n=1 Tax=Thermomonospora curvata (strain ATCC 19995 / DSM 43183 / JCM 3096 / KCTC 9072 / NBRC 15933 / NCIMB 10081 / Henssen B9) TaxID=471852 RepID=D1A704_THECD|nr:MULTISPECIES: type 1 glutamine amidotransferase domain-containing protein [Thermomonospora]ACY98408.1 intracellular protease, PfpI family [Thermomonospora curvata DSM 43183]PKK13560.1 MAG: type 1 glutamine amidotransferase [Thermomonospora sp. CIF 1]